MDFKDLKEKIGLPLAVLTMGEGLTEKELKEIAFDECVKVLSEASRFFVASGGGLFLMKLPEFQRLLC